ncbi:MAG: DUF1353 domain-containing protein [Pseudomonadota bacterium]
MVISPARRQALQGLILAPGDLEATGTLRENRPEFRTLRDVWFEDVRVPAGFVTDKHSLPFVIKGFQPKHARWAGPPILHDWLYETQIKTKIEADLLYWRAMRAIDVKMVHRIPAALAVLKFGRRGYGKVDADNFELVNRVSGSKMMARSEDRLTRKLAYMALGQAAQAARGLL